MAMAEPQAPAKARPAMSCCMWLFFVITMATVNKPILVKAHLPSPPSPHVLYIHDNRIPGSPEATDVIVVSPSGIYDGSVVEFGTIAVVAAVVRKGKAEDSPALGQAVGQVTVAKDGSLYLALAYVLNTPSYSGSITVQGTTDSLGNGELAITGGTGDFRGARGYVELRLVNDEDEADVVFKATFHVKYD